MYHYHLCLLRSRLWCYCSFLFTQKFCTLRCDDKRAASEILPERTALPLRLKLSTKVALRGLVCLTQLKKRLFSPKENVGAILAILTTIAALRHVGHLEQKHNAGLQQVHRFRLLLLPLTPPEKKKSPCIFFFSLRLPMYTILPSFIH